MAYDRVSIEVTYTPLTGPASKFVIHSCNSYELLCFSIVVDNCQFLEVDDRLIETYIKETCESAILVSFHPNTMVCINLQEMQDSGGVRVFCVIY